MKKRVLLLILFFVLAAVLVVGAVVGVKVILPGYRLYRDVTIECPVEQKVDELRAGEHYTAFDDLSDTYKNAVVAVEDHGFYDHGAVSVKALLRVGYYYLLDGEVNQGGSTITQQVAKNFYFGMEQSITRKVAEIFVAAELEKKYEKNDILELYANCIYFGSGYYCIFDASIGYYGVAPAALNDFESTVLAGVPNAPSVYSPDNDTPLTYERQRQVVDSMIKYGYLSEDEGKTILAAKPE